jgi:type IV pilus assembly protein PilO
MKDLPVWAQMLIVIVLIIALTIMGHIYLLKPQGTDIGKKDEELSKLKTENNKAAIIEKSMPEFEAEVKRLEERLKELVQILPTTLETEVIVDKIKGIADNYHVQIVDIAPKPLAVKGVYSEFTMVFKVRGTYHTIALFFDKLAKMERIVNVPETSLKRVKSKDLAVSVEGTFTATTYVYRQ